MSCHDMGVVWFLMLPVLLMGFKMLEEGGRLGAALGILFMLVGLSGCVLLPVTSPIWCGPSLLRSPGSAHGAAQAA